MRHPLIKIFQLSNWLQMPDDHRMVYIQFFTNFSCKCKRIEFSGCSQLVVIKFRPRASGWGCHDHPVVFLLGSPGSSQDWMIPTNTVARMGGLEVNYPPRHHNQEAPMEVGPEMWVPVGCRLPRILQGMSTGPPGWQDLVGTGCAGPVQVGWTELGLTREPETGVSSRFPMRSPIWS